MIRIPTPKNLVEFYQYEMQLSRAFHHIERRGVMCDVDKLEELRQYITKGLLEVELEMSGLLKANVAFSKEQAESRGWTRKEYINLASPSDILNLLRLRGLKVPKNRMTGRETTGEDALNQIYADSGDEVIRRILHARELTKILGTYVNVRLFDGILYSSYRVTGTVTGRRSAGKNIFGYGTNHQNLPKHSDLGRRFRSCVRARNGKIFVNCDQCQAEDWIVSGIIADVGADFHGLEELRSGKDRHTRLASKLFSRPEAECGKDTLERFMGKKVRHAGNYDMGPDEFARQLVKEGLRGDKRLCAAFLEIFHNEEPGIRDVFHKHIQRELESTRMLRTPLGRERIFMGCRPYDNNKQVFKEAYAFEPQSTVGDNTGLAILYCECNWPDMVVLDTHDAVSLEVGDNEMDVVRGVELLSGGFDRKIVFPNGLEIIIPVEFEIGYSLGEMVAMKNGNICAALEKAKQGKSCEAMP